MFGTRETVRSRRGFKRKGERGGRYRRRHTLRCEVLEPRQLLAVSPTGGLTLDFSTYFGGSNSDSVETVHVDDSGFIYIAGETTSTDLATPGAFDETGGWPTTTRKTDIRLSDTFVAKLSPDGSDVLWTTYLEGRARDTVTAIRTDATGAVYVVGGTSSTDWPTTPGAFRTLLDYGGNNNPLAHEDVFVTKIAPDGSDLLYSTYFGGSDQEIAYDMHLTPNGGVFITGETNSADFYTLDTAVQPNHGGGEWDAFVTFIMPDGTPGYSTYLGGSGNDSATGIAFTDAGPGGPAIILAGNTDSADFPATAGAYQTSLRGGQDAFVASMRPDLMQYHYGTYVGGTDLEIAGEQGVTVDSAGRAIVTGITDSGDFPTTAGAFQDSIAGFRDLFVFRLANDGSALEASTLIGGSFYEERAGGVALDSNENVLITGGTASTDYPVTADALQPSSAGDRDVVVTQFSPDLTSTLHSTYVGGFRFRTRAFGDRGHGIVVIVGEADSTDFPTTSGALQTTYAGGINDGFVMRFDLAEGDALDVLGLSSSAFSVDEGGATSEASAPTLDDSGKPEPTTAASFAAALAEMAEEDPENEGIALLLALVRRHL